MRIDLELNGYLQGTSTDSGIDATSFTATQSSTASSTGAFRAKEKSPWQDESAGSQRATDMSPPTPDSLVAIGGSENPVTSPSAFPPDSYSLSDAASHSRCAAVLLESAELAAEEFVPLHQCFIKQTVIHCSPDISCTIPDGKVQSSAVCGLALTKGKGKNEITVCVCEVLNLYVSQSPDIHDRKEMLDVARNADCELSTVPPSSKSHFL